MKCPFLVKRAQSKLVSVYNSLLYVGFVRPEVKDMMIVLSAMKFNKLQCLHVYLQLILEIICLPYSDVIGQFRPFKKCYLFRTLVLVFRDKFSVSNFRDKLREY